MSARDDRLRRQQQDEAAWQSQQRERPGVPPGSVPLSEQCPARLGGRHNYTMKNRTDNILRCWYCAKEKPEAR